VRRLLTGLLVLCAAHAQGFQDFTHFSQVMGADRAYRVYFPAGYSQGQKRFPVIYWLHGFEASGVRDAHAKAFADFTAAHEVIVVDTGPVETTGQFPLYFPELVEHVDQMLRTVPGREHRAVSGYGLGGFLALWTGSKFADLAGSVSSVNPAEEAELGPHGFEVQCALDDLRAGLRDAMAMESAPDAVRALEFHMRAFAAPPKPPDAFSHVDPYPNFSVWGWEAASNRRRPGFTALEHVSAHGFRSAVREWLPGGAELNDIKLSIETALKTYAPNSLHAVTYIHLADGKIRHAQQKADAQGRLSFEVDGGDYEVGISAGPTIAVSGFEVDGAAWAETGKPVRLKVKFWNVGASRSGTLPVQWESGDARVKYESPAGRLFGLGPGETVSLPVGFTFAGAAPANARIAAVVEGERFAIDVPLFPAPEAAKNFLIADGRPLEAFQHGSQKAEITLGEGNGDGYAAPGEGFAVLLPDGDSFRVAELFTNDACVDTSVRETDPWSGTASVNYTVARIRADCEPGRRLHLLARTFAPGPAGPVARYAAIEIPVWYRTK
jgi:hypothetical protein